MPLQGRLTRVDAQPARLQFKLTPTTALAASLSGLLSLGVSTAALAQMVIDNQTVTVPPNFPPVIGALTVGENGTGILNINSGGTVSNTGNAFLADNVGSTGIVTVTGPNAVWTNGGGLEIAVQGTGTVTIQNGANVSSTSLQVAQATTSTGALTITGPGSRLTVTGALYDLGVFGTATVNVTNGGALLAANGFLDVGVGAGPGTTQTVNITSGGTFTSDFAIIGVFNEGTAMVTVNGPGSVWTNTNTLTIGLGGPGSSTLTIANGGIVNSGPVGIAESGGPGTLNIGAAPGDAPVAPGTLNTPSVTFGTGTGTINFNHTSTNDIFTPTISGPGAINVLAGTTIFPTGNANTYTGPTTISGGVLVVNGSIASPTTVSGSGTLAGTGMVNAAVTINSGGTFSPGTPGVPGTFMNIGVGVGNNLTFNQGSQYRVFLSPPTTASFANVTGTATLTGGTVDPVFLPGAYTINDRFLILHTTGGLNGTTFGGQATTNFSYVLTYEPAPPLDVFLTITGAQLGAGTQLTINEQNVSNAINEFFNGGGTLPPGFGALFSLSGPTLANALTQLSGEVGTGAERTAFGLMTQFLNLMTEPYAIGFAPERQPGFLKAPPMLKAPPATFSQRWTAWGAAFGGSNHANGDAVIGSHDITASDFGFAAGVDYHYSPGTLLGFALAGAGTNWGLAQGLGTGRSDAFMAGIHGVTHSGPAYLTGAFGFADHAFTIDRTSFASDQLRSTFNGQSFGGRLEGGYRFAVPFDRAVVGIAPYAAVQAQWFHTPGYSESDLTGGGFGLTYNAMTANDTRSELGARSDALTTFYGNPLVLRGRLAWAHDWVSNPALNAAFQALPGTAFTVFGAPIPQDSALTTASAELHFSPNWSFTAKFDGEFASRSQTYAGTGTLRYTW